MRRVLIFIVATVFLVLAIAGAAYAASPQDIYNDYAQDQKLDGTYTDAELQAYLNDAGVHQYGNAATLTALDALVQQMLEEDRGEFPFTGSELALIVIAAFALVGAGLAIRRVARSRS